MKKQKVGLIIFLIAIIWGIFWGVVVSVPVDSAYNRLTLEELDQTMWSTTGPWIMIWAFGVPLGALIAAIGILLYSGAKGSSVWKCGIIIFLGIAAAMASGFLTHIPVLFGLGGTIILLSFIGILWFWAKERKALEGGSTAASDFRLLGYVFMVIAAWFICGMASFPFLKAYENADVTTPLHIMIYLVLGWIFMFLSHYKAQKQ